MKLLGFAANSGVHNGNQSAVHQLFMRNIWKFTIFIVMDNSLYHLKECTCWECLQSHFWHKSTVRNSMVIFKCETISKVKIFLLMNEMLSGRHKFPLMCMENSRHESLFSVSKRCHTNDGRLHSFEVPKKKRLKWTQNRL